jgi:hypothetical protein
LRNIPLWVSFKDTLAEVKYLTGYAYPGFTEIDTIKSIPDSYILDTLDQKPYQARVFPLYANEELKRFVPQSQKS